MVIYADLLNKTACVSTSGDAFRFPDMLAGDRIEHSVRFLEKVGTKYVEVQLPVAALRASIGAIDARPDSGQFTFKVGSEAASASNTTTKLSWDASAATVQAALNAVADKPGQFVVDFAEGTYRISIQSFASFALAVRENTLSPLSAIRLNAVSTDGRFYYTARATQLPVTFTDTTRLRLPNPPTISTVQDGATDPSGVVAWNEIQALFVPPDFRGTYQLRRDLAKTSLLDHLDGPAELQTALNAMLRFENGTVKVTNPTANTAHIEFQGDLEGSNLDPLIVAVTSHAPADLTWTLDLSTLRIRELMDLYPTITVPYEVEADIYNVAGNPSSGTYTIKLWSQNVTIKRPLIWPELATVQEIDWLRPPNAVSYNPFDFSQILTGSQQAVVAGMTSGTVHAIAHNFGTPAVQVSVREAHDGGQLLNPDEYSVAFPSLNEAVITLNEEPATPLVAHLIGIGPASAFQSHTHGIHQITQLQDILDQLGERVARLESLIGRPDFMTIITSGNKAAQFKLPDIGEILPDRAIIGAVTNVTSQVSYGGEGKGTQIVGGTDLEERLRDEEAERKRIAAEQEAAARAQAEAAKKAAEELAARTAVSTGSIIARMTFPEYTATYPSLRGGGRLPFLLPALKDTTITDTTVLPASPVVGVYRNAGGASLLLPPANGRKSQAVVPEAYFAWDGRMFYRVIKRGDHFYPQEMERVLWRALVRDDVLPPGAIAHANFDLTLDLRAGGPDAASTDTPRLDVGAQYLIIFDYLETTDLTGAPNIGAASAPVTIGEFRIPLSAARMTNRFGVRLARSTAESSSEAFGLNRTISGPSLPANFALRCHLSCFDVDDSTADPRGSLTVSMPGAVLTIEKT